MTDRYSNLDTDEEYEEADFGGEYHEDDDEMDYGGAQQEASSASASRGKKEDWSQPADINYKTVVITATKSFRPCDFIRNYDPTKPTDESKWELRNRGTAVLSFGDRSLKIEKGSGEDFKEAIRRWKEEDKKENSAPYKDLIKSMKFVDMTSNFPKGLDFEFKTVPTFNDDFNHSGTGNVVHTFLPGTLSMKPKNFDILERSITKGNMLLDKKFPGDTHLNIEQTITKFAGTDSNFVPYNGILHSFHNMDLPEKQKITKFQSLNGGKHKVVEMTEAQTKNALEKAQKELGNTLVRADLTNNFRIAVTATPSNTRLKLDKQWKETKGTKEPKGKEWRGLADLSNIAPEATATERAALMEKEYTISKKIVIEYYQ